MLRNVNAHFRAAIVALNHQKSVKNSCSSKESSAKLWLETLFAFTVKCDKPTGFEIEASAWHNI